MEKIIEIHGLNFVYDSHVVLENITFEVKEKDFVGIIGPNGGGKTTLLRIILGLLKPISGEIRIFGKNPKKSRNLIGYVPQFIEINRNFPISVKDVILMGLINPNSFFPSYNKKDIELALDAMKAVNIDNIQNEKFGELSIGQKQRALIARALISNPKLLLLDEPTASVDSRVESDFFKLLKKLNESLTIILISHDLGFISSYVNKVVCVNKHLVTHKPHQINKEIIFTLYNNSSMEMIQHECNL